MKMETEEAGPGWAAAHPQQPGENNDSLALVTFTLFPSVERRFD